MTDQKSKSKPSGKSNYVAAPPFKKVNFENDQGIPQVVFVPPGETDPKAGIPLSLDLSPLFGHMPNEFQRTFYKALHAQGLIEPADFFKQGAAERYQRALRDVLKHDFLSVQALAKQELQHG
jgi:hypothetical protein